MIPTTPQALEVVSDAIDEGIGLRSMRHSVIDSNYSRVVNKLKAAHAWDDVSEFDAGKDKAKFRQYDEACDRVKAFYKEQHGMHRGHCRLQTSSKHSVPREANGGIQSQCSSKLQEDRSREDG